MTSIPVHTLSAFLSQPPKALPHFLIFFASPTPSQPISWCPDCVVALPVLRAEIPAEQCTMIYVGSRPEWKDKESVFRTEWGLSSVPTLVRIPAGTEKDALKVTVKMGTRLLDPYITNVKSLRSFVRGE